MHCCIFPSPPRISHLKARRSNPHFATAGASIAPHHATVALTDRSTVEKPSMARRCDAGSARGNGRRSFFGSRGPPSGAASTRNRTCPRRVPFEVCLETVACTLCRNPGTKRPQNAPNRNHDPVRSTSINNTTKPVSRVVTNACILARPPPARIRATCVCKSARGQVRNSNILRRSSVFSRGRPLYERT